MPTLVKFEVLEAHDMTSDHLPFQAIIKLKCEEKKKADQSTQGKFPVFNFKKANWEKFTEILSSCNLYEEENDVEAINDLTTEALLKAAKESIPTYVTKTKKSFPKFIVDLIEARKFQRKHYKQTKAESVKKNITN